MGGNPWGMLTISRISQDTQNFQCCSNTNTCYGTVLSLSSQLNEMFGNIKHKHISLSRRLEWQAITIVKRTSANDECCQDEVAKVLVQTWLCQGNIYTGGAAESIALLHHLSSGLQVKTTTWALHMFSSSWANSSPKNSAFLSFDCKNLSRFLLVFQGNTIFIA